MLGRLASASLTLTLSLSLTLPAREARALVWPDVPERVERGLAATDPVARRAAARELSALGAARAAPLVLKAMADSDVEVRRAAAQAAIRLRVTAATDVALQWLGERDSKLRIAACEVAGALPDPRVVPVLARSLGDSDPLVRAACVDALGAQPSADAVAPLSGKLDDPTPSVRVEVARALARLGDPRAVVPLVGKVQDSVPEVRQAVVRALGDLGDPRAAQSLLLALRDNVAEVKIEALAALGRLRAPDAASAIAPLALERNPSVRHAALVALGRIATPEAVRALARALGTQEDAGGTLERTPVRDALVAAGAPAVAELTAMLERPIAPNVATSAAWVLGALSAKKSAAVIVSALRRGTLPPAAALRGLAGAGSASEVPVVLEFVADPSPAVREEAVRAATALLDPAHPDGRAVEPLVASLRSTRLASSERAAMATLLGRTGAPRAAKELAGLISAKDPTLRLASIDALGALGRASAESKSGDLAIDDALAPLVADPDPAVRLHAAVALGASGGARARTLLLSKLDGGEEVDRYAILTALGGILERHSDEASVKKLFALLPIAAGPERDAILEAVSRAHLPLVVRTLADLARKADVDDRRMIASILSAHGDQPEALALTRTLARDADGAVRARAAFALGAFDDPSVLPLLQSLTKVADVDVATNAAGAIALLARRASARAAGQSARAGIAKAACGLLADPRAAVRTNALVTLSFLATRCGDGKTERKLLGEDPSELVRAAAARAMIGKPIDGDRSVLDRCVSTDRSPDVAHVCRPLVESAARDTRRPPRAVTAFIVGEGSVTAKPREPFLVEYDGGLLRAGIADRRGATFDPAAPSGELRLRRAPLR